MLRSGVSFLHTRPVLLGQKRRMPWQFDFSEIKVDFPPRTKLAHYQSVTSINSHESAGCGVPDLTPFLTINKL